MTDSGEANAVTLEGPAGARALASDGGWIDPTEPGAARLLASEGAGPAPRASRNPAGLRCADDGLPPLRSGAERARNPREPWLLDEILAVAGLVPQTPAAERSPTRCFWARLEDGPEDLEDRAHL